MSRVVIGIVFWNLDRIGWCFKNGEDSGDRRSLWNAIFDWFHFSLGTIKPYCCLPVREKVCYPLY